jgi:hypothetical protein
VDLETAPAKWLPGERRERNPANYHYLKDLRTAGDAIALHLNANVIIIKEHVRTNEKEEVRGFHFYIADLTRFAHRVHHLTPIWKVPSQQSFF